MEREDRHAERVIRRDLRVCIETPFCEGICSADLQAGIPVGGKCLPEGGRYMEPGSAWRVLKLLHTRDEQEKRGNYDGNIKQHGGGQDSSWARRCLVME